MLLELFYLILSSSSVFAINPKRFESDQGFNLTKSRRTLLVHGLPAPQRLFYVRIVVTGDGHGYFCGGALIDQQWVLTSAKCIHGNRVDRLTVEVKINVDEDGSYLKKIPVYSGHSSHVPHVYPDASSLSLLKLWFKAPYSHIIPICGASDNPTTAILGSCGMGSITPYPYTFTSTLQEIAGYETLTLGRDPAHLEPCPKNSVCLDPATATSSLCAGDEGNPLYMMECCTFEPSCLYGIGMYSKNVDIHRKPSCYGGSVFSRVSSYVHWIENVLNEY